MTSPPISNMQTVGSVGTAATRLSRLRIIHGNSNPQLALDVCKELGVDVTPSKVDQYTNGEVRIQILDPVRGDDCFILQPTCGSPGVSHLALNNNENSTAPASPPINVNQALMELLLMIQTLRLSSAKRITAVIPHFAYARQDRKTQPRVPISASAIATMISTMGVDRVITMDLHCTQIQGFFQNIPVFDISSASIFAQHILTSPDLQDMNSIVVVAPDAGAVARARKLADLLHVARIVTILKRRLCANKVESMQLVGEVQDSICLIFDDMIDTAGTLCKAASVLVEWGAKKVYAFATHGILTDPAIQRITDCAALTEVVVTDTIPQMINQERCSKLRVLSAAPLIGEVIGRVYREEAFEGEIHTAQASVQNSIITGLDDSAAIESKMNQQDTYTSKEIRK